MPSASDTSASAPPDGQAGIEEILNLCNKFAMLCLSNSLTLLPFAQNIQRNLLLNKEVSTVDALKYLLHAEIAMSDEHLATVQNYDSCNLSAGADVYTDKLCVNEAGFQNILHNPLFTHIPKSVLSPDHVGYLRIQLPSDRLAEIMVLKNPVSSVL